MKRTSPLILASIPLVVDPLLDDVLVLGIVGVDDLDRWTKGVGFFGLGLGPGLLLLDTLLLLLGHLLCHFLDLCCLVMRAAGQ